MAKEVKKDISRTERGPLEGGEGVEPLHATAVPEGEQSEGELEQSEGELENEDLDTEEDDTEGEDQLSDEDKKKLELAEGFKNRAKAEPVDEETAKKLGDIVLQKLRKNKVVAEEPELTEEEKAKVEFARKWMAGRKA